MQVPVWRWSSGELSSRSVIRQLVDAPDSDLFDVFGYVLFEHPPRTRRERAEDVRRDGLEEAGSELRELLLGILRAYEEQGEGELATPKLGSYLTARYGGVGESRGRLGNLSAVRTAFRRMQTNLYAS